ncbi:MAG TPA: M14 family metallopeptidase [Candidatus Paceibacterota bacterium]|nr:M14 family metallopeptidase [Candidatus Paceibacterota bacterium]
MKTSTLIAGVLLFLILIGAGAYFFMKPSSETAYVAEKPLAVAPTPTPVAPEKTAPVVPAVKEDTTKTVLGASVEGRNIVAYHFGTGTKEILFVGGIHGGYEWNTALVAYELMDHLAANPKAVPPGVKVTVIPVMNPDGLNKVVGTTTRFSAAQVPTGKDATVPGRFNANKVDLNRNFDCDWQPTGTWQNTPVSGGSKAFSEPESIAIQKYVTAKKPTAVVVWYSAVGGVFSSNCHNGVLPETKTLTKIYSDASKYKAYEEFNFYEITGDMVNWLAKNNIPAISVLLTNHTNTEWAKNKAGVEAVLAHYAK